MKNKRIVSILIIFLIVTLTGCRKSIIDISKEVAYLNENQAHIYTYGEHLSIDKINSSFVTIDDIDLTFAFIAIAIDCSKYYDKMSKELVEEFYSLLNSEKKAMVLFVQGENYNFFENTSFANEKGLYANEGYVYGFYNFSTLTGITEISYDLSTNEEMKMEYALVATFYRRVYSYIGAL